MLLWCLSLLAYRNVQAAGVFDGSGQKASYGMVWNLFLAMLPLAFSTAFQAASAHKQKIAAGIWFVLWLLFLPNAPYLFTDLLHLHPSPSIPMWLVLAVFASCAGTGVLLGYWSLLPIHDAVERRWGKAAGWGVAAGAWFLSGFGIYLGRVLHWNSWDAVVRPMRLLGNIANQFLHPGSRPHPLSYLLVYGVGLLVGYAALRGFPETSSRQS